MALRMRSTTTVNRTQENSIGIGKAKTNVTGLTKRPALGEISNVQTRHTSNLNKDGPGKKEIKKPTTLVQKQTVTASKQTLICKTTTLVKPSKAIIRPSVSSAPAPPVIAPKPRIRPTISKTASSSSLIQKSIFAPTRIDAPVVPKNADFRDIDKESASSPILLGEYAAEIFAFMREIETNFVVKEDFLDEQQVTPKMRAMVVDWLVDVQLQYSLLIETLHLAIGIFDRFLQKHTTVTRQKLQLVGVTSMWIACKYEELFSPELENFVYITDRAYTQSEIMKMEQLIHKTLDFCYGQPLSIHFLRRYSNASKADPKHHTCAKYFLELALVSYRLRSVRPSIVAAVALYISFCVIDETPPKEIWNESLTFYSTYSFKEIKPFVPVLAEIIINTKTSKLQAVQRKYSTNKQHNISEKVHLKAAILEKLAKMETDKDTKPSSSKTK